MTAVSRFNHKPERQLPDAGMSADDFPELPMVESEHPEA